VLNRLQTDPDKTIYHRTPWAWVTILADLVTRIDHDDTYPDKLWAHTDNHPHYKDGLKHPSAV